MPTTVGTTCGIPITADDGPSLDDYLREADGLVASGFLRSVKHTLRHVAAHPGAQLDPIRPGITHDYTCRAVRFIKKRLEFNARYGKALELQDSNPYHSSLRLHAFRGRLHGLHSELTNAPGSTPA